MQYHSTLLNIYQFNAILFNITQCHAIQLDVVQENAIPCNTMTLSAPLHYMHHAIPFNTI